MTNINKSIEVSEDAKIQKYEVLPTYIGHTLYSLSESASSSVNPVQQNQNKRR